MITVRVAAVSAALCFGVPLVALAQTDPGTGQGAPAASGTSSRMTASEQEAQRRLENQGYTQVTDVKSTAEGISAKAMKDGKEVVLTIDSSGKVQEK
jgi:pectin methylesterase-like acyl-CoA thioesterase